MKADDTIVVIGGSSGIGLAVARRSLDDGATVVIAGRSRSRLDAARAELAQPDMAQTGAPGGRLVRIRSTSATQPRSPGSSSGSERSATWL